jgi:hypothetical protein
MKENFIAFVGFFILSCSASLAQAVLEKAGDFYPRHDWIERLQYRPGEVCPIQFKMTPCPLIEVKIDGKSFWLTFDFGSAGGMMVTTAIEDKITYEVVRDLSTIFADGRPRGRGKEIVLTRVEVFGKTHDRVSCELYDWRIFSSSPNDGGISLAYIENTRFTLDYRNKRLAVSDSPFPEGLLKDGGFAVIPLLKSPEWNKYGLYLKGKVNGQDVVIYIDSGSSHSFVDRSLFDEKSISKVGNNDVCLSKIPVSLDGLDMKISKVRVSDIRRNTNYDRPVRMTMGSDLLKSFVFTVDRTEGRNDLIVHK